MIPSRRALAYLVVVFLLGLALGVLATLWASKRGYTYDASHPRREVRGVEWLDQELNLTPEQHRQVEAILDETGESYRAIRQRTRPEYEAVRQQGRDRIRGVLEPQQLARFEELVREIDRKEAERRQKRENASAGEVK